MHCSLSNEVISCNLAPQLATLNILIVVKNMG